MLNAEHTVIHWCTCDVKAGRFWPCLIWLSEKKIIIIVGWMPMHMIVILLEKRRFMQKPTFVPLQVQTDRHHTFLDAAEFQL